MKCAVRKWLMLPVVLAILLCALLFGCREARADVATDTLEIRVGYSGMELKNYVSVGKYNWQELYENLPMYDRAYSYYQEGNFGKFTEVVDSASGFFVMDILDYAHINYGDVYNLKFYVEDHQGIQASFDRDELFKTRYYFKDFNGTAVSYDEDGNRVVDPELCWSNCEEVEPMLAIEDNWASFTEEMEHADSDFEFMNTANRFRLLFGQTEPTETGTSSLSAKYVSCVYITLYGKPTYGETPELDGTYGTHTVEFEVNTDNETVRDALSEVMDVNSTNEDVLVIRGYKVTPDSFYSDKVTVEVEYEIVGEGEASIQAGIGSMAFGSSDSSGSDSSGNAVAATINNTGTAGGSGQGEQKKDDTEAESTVEKEDNTSTSSDTKTDDTEFRKEDTNKGSVNQIGQTDGGSGSGSAAAGSSNVSGGEGTGTDLDTGNDAVTTTGSEDSSGTGDSDGIGNITKFNDIVDDTDSGQTAEVVEDQSGQTAQIAMADGADSQKAGSTLNTYSLTGSAADQMAAASVAAPVQEAMQPDHAVTGVEIEDTTEMDLHDQRLRMALIGLACVGICVLGGLFQKLWYRRRVK